MKLFCVGIDRSVSVGDPTSPLKRPGLVTIRSTLIIPSACDLYLRDFERMRGLPYQNARILSRSSFGASRLNYLLILIHSFILSISIALLQGDYSGALPIPVRPKRKV